MGSGAGVDTSGSVGLIAIRDTDFSFLPQWVHPTGLAASALFLPA